MYLVIEVDSDIQVIVFNWVFEYEVLFDVIVRDMWHLILYVNDEEWRDSKMPDDSDLPEDVFWFCLCTNEEFDDAM